MSNFTSFSHGLTTYLSCLPSRNNFHWHEFFFIRTLSLAPSISLYGKFEQFGNVDNFTDNFGIQDLGVWLLFFDTILRR